MITGAQVIIDSVDQSANLTGEVLTADIEENSARTASFTLLLILGVSELLGWVGKSVVVKSVIDSVVKTEFTGVIVSPIKNIETGLTTFTCTDNMQENFETKTKTEIDAIISAYWSEAVFNDSDGWEYAKERLSTIPKSISMDELNTVRLTDWAAKATPDYTFSDSGYIYNSLQIDAIADRQNIINGVDIVDLEYRYIRLKQRKQAYSWLDTGDVCDFYINPYPLPSQTRILNSIYQTGWEITVDATFTLPPASGLYTCGLDDVAWIQNTTLAQGVDFSIAKRYSQNITEIYTIRVESADSIAALGDISVTQSAALATDYDTSDWDTSSVNDGFADYGVPLTDINNDQYINKDDDTERQGAIDTAINLAKTRILSSHRNTIVSFDIPYNQDIDEIHTALMSATKLSAKGKIYSVVKKINTLTGSAITTISIRLSKPFGTGTPSADDPPVTPDALPTVIDTQIVDLNLLSHLGGQDPTAYDPNWSGWITDYDTITEPAHVSYPTEFAVHTPAITLNSIDNIDATDISLINVTIPDDTLS